MTDQNTALADELQNPWKNNHTDSERGPLPDWCLGLLQRAAAALRTPAPAPATVGGDVVERLAYGYELMHQAICHMAGTSGGDARWYHDKAKDVFERVSPVFKITSESNAHMPGDCLSGYKTLFAALQAQPTASTAQPVSGDPFDPETDGTDCPSCGGQNTSCPDGCGREPETGELNGTRLETAQPDEVVEAMARAISEAGDCPRESNQTVAGAWWWDTRYDHPGNEFAHECRANDIKLARAALAAMQQQAPVADDVAKAIEPVRPWYESDEHPPRELAAIVADIVSDLQSDRAECLRKSMLSDDQVKHMVNRFLMWKLPDNFNPDGGVSFEPEYNVEYNAKQGLPPQRHEPSGTNLLDYTQAEAMVRHMLDGLTQPQADAAVAVEPVTLNECPPGLFMFNGTLCFKSKYTTTLENERRYQVDAYCVESGEYFHGWAKSSSERGNLMVEPVDITTIRAGGQP